MPSVRLSPPAPDLLAGMLESFTINDRMNQLILEHLNPRSWQAKLPNAKGTRTIAAIFTHMHNIRRKWIRLSAPHLKLPAELHRSRCSIREARTALAQSAKLCATLLAEALAHPNNRVSKFRRDAWARPWPAGASMFAYMLTHDAHHRGQICMLANQLGFPLPNHVNYGLWSWEKLCKQCGFPNPR